MIINKEKKSLLLRLGYESPFEDRTLFSYEKHGFWVEDKLFLDKTINHVVKSGEYLWMIPGIYYSKSKTNEELKIKLVKQIVALNRLSGGLQHKITPKMILKVPSYIIHIITPGIYGLWLIMREYHTLSNPEIGKLVTKTRKLNNLASSTVPKNITTIKIPAHIPSKNSKPPKTQPKKTQPKKTTPAPSNNQKNIPKAPDVLNLPFAARTRGKGDNELIVYDKIGNILTFKANKHGMVELPHDEPEVTGRGTYHGKFTIGGKRVYNYYNRNDENYGKPEDQWGPARGIAALINAIAYYKKKNPKYAKDIFRIGDMHTPKGGAPYYSTHPLRTHHGSQQISPFDIGLLSKDGKSVPGLTTSSSKFSILRTQAFINALNRFGFKRIFIHKGVAYKLKSGKNLRVYPDPKHHHDHYHIDFGKRW